MEPKHAVHTTLAKSYLVYFVASLMGLFADMFISFPLDVPFAKTIAIIFFGLGPLIILWAQYTSGRFQKENPTLPYFHHGPYRFVRNPTHLGLLILVTGYTLISGSMVFFGVTLIGFLISNILFSKYEKILHESHGDKYKDYKATTPKIL